MIQSCLCSAGPTHKVLTWWVESSATAMFKKEKVTIALTEAQETQTGRRSCVSEVVCKHDTSLDCPRIFPNMCPGSVQKLLRKWRRRTYSAILLCMTFAKAKGSNLCQVKEQLQETPLLIPTPTAVSLYLCLNHLLALTPTLSSGARLSCQIWSVIHPSATCVPLLLTAPQGEGAPVNPHFRLSQPALAELGVNLWPMPGAEVVSNISLHWLCISWLDYF